MATKNLVYFAAFNNLVYVDLLEILMATMKLYSNLENIDFLVFTSGNLKGRIDEISAKLDIKIQTQIFNFAGLHEGLCARMRIFDYCDIDKYDKVLYLDTDIVVQNDISVLFAQDIEEKLYALKEGTIEHEYYGSDFFDFATVDKNTAGMNSGILLFKPTSTILQLFRNAYEHMSSILIQNLPMPSCSDQALINYHFVKNGMHQTGFLEKYGLIYANERFSTPPPPPSGPTDIILCHFAAPVGDANGKKARMVNHVTHILNHYKNIQGSYSQIPSMLIGKDYTWGDGHIFFGANGSLITKWSRTGAYEIWNSHVVKASWSGFHHALIFNKEYTRFISIRISDVIISAHQLIVQQSDLIPVKVETKSKNLLYCCVFYNKDYLKLLELLLLSMKFYSSETFDILVLTSPEFEESVHQISKALNLKIQVACVNVSTIFEAACARLRIFDYSGITEYKNLLYLDTDIIIKGDLAPLFQIELEERLYGLEQGSIDSPNFGKMFFSAQTDFSIKGLNSGTLLFKNCLAIRDLFSRIRGHIAAFTDSSQTAPYALDQPFINYHAIKDGLYDNKTLNPYVSLYEDVDTVTNYATSLICHFSFPIGNFAHKYHRMKEFLIGLLSIHSTKVPSPHLEIKNILDKQFSLLSTSRLLNLFNQCVKFQNTGYSFVECGVAKGGALALMKYASTNNPVFGFDSFEGMPDIVEKDLGDYNKSDPLHGHGMVGHNLSGGIESVYTTFKSLNYSLENVHLVKGFFNNTLALNKSRCGKIAVLRIDADWYESCKICLEELYDQVIEGGVIIIDDYGHFIGAKRATDEFREARGIASPLIQTDYTEFYWIKGASEMNQLVGKSYSWGSGYIKFGKNHLETTWGNGIYSIKDANKIIASWNGYNHILQFNNDYTTAISIRTVPNDCLISFHSSKYTAIIVEPRKHPAMKFVLNNFLENLDKRWSFMIFHGIDNKEWLEDIINSNFSSEKSRIKLINLNISNITWSQYNTLIATASFINQIPTETFLIFQTDTMISSLYKNLIYDFIDYDYVGAPWFKTEGSNCPFNGNVGNGGLSLRKKSKILEVINSVPYPNNIGEDEYYCIYNKTVLLNKPTYEKAKLFAIETTYSPISFGLHKPWCYIKDYDLEKQFPGYNELVRLNQI